MVCSLSSSVSTHYQEEQKKDQGDEIHSNVQEFPLLSRHLVDPILQSATAILCELVLRGLESLTIEDSVLCHLPFPKLPFRRQITDLSNATIKY